MHAQLVQCLVAVGDAVRADDVLLVIEAMKMEHELRAQADGTVTQLYCQMGDVVNADDLLLILERDRQEICRLEPKKHLYFRTVYVPCNCKRAHRSRLSAQKPW